MQLTGVIGLLFTFLQIGDCANILAVFPFDGRSHFNVYENLLVALAKKGHNLDVISHFPRENRIPRYNDFSLQGSMPQMQNKVPFGFLGNSHLHDIRFILRTLGVELCRATLNTTAAEELKRSTKKYDVMITEIFSTDCMLGYAHIFNVPTIAMTSSVNVPWASDRFGIPDNPAYIPNYFTPYLERMSLKERVLNTLMLIGTKIGYKRLSLDDSNVVAKNFFGPDLPDLHDLANNMSLLLVNSHFSMHQSRPFPPNFVEVGGLHIGKNKTLPKHYEEALQTDLKGVIYLSFGSMLRTETLPEHVLRSFFEAFAQLPYKVMWKAVREDFPKHIEIPNNIQFQPWMPQLQILCHPNVKLFVSHGGLLGTQEAIYCGVPVLGIPIFADQELNIKTSEAKGVAIALYYKDITKETLYLTAQQLLEDPKYKRNAERTSQMFRDRPMSPLDTAIYWVEYVIRYGGAPQLRSVGADLPWYQYYLIDVTAVLIAGVLFIVACVYYFLLFVYSVIVFNKNAGKLKTH